MQKCGASYFRFLTTIYHIKFTFSTSLDFQDVETIVNLTFLLLNLPMSHLAKAYVEYKYYLLHLNL